MMNPTHIFAYFISGWLWLCGSVLQAQNNNNKPNTSKTTAEKQEAKISKRKNDTYGLRAGIDLKKFTQTIFDKNYRGFELVGDYRLTETLYLAAELGNERKSIVENSLSTTTNGSYIKVGIDTNVYKNLVGIRNLIFVGARYGIANFSQRLDSFSIATQNTFFPSEIIDDNSEQSGLNAHWLEAIAGIKVEVLQNVFLGMSVSVQYKLFDEKPKGFDNLYIPGFGTTNDFSNFSAGFNYFISYYLPLYKKKKVKSSVDKNEEVKE